jgi:hypothetical protein
MSTTDISSIDPSLSLDEIIAIQQLLRLGTDTEFKSEFKSKSPTKDKSEEVLKLESAKVFDEEYSDNVFEVVLVGWKTYFRDINDGKMYDPDTQELVGEDGKLY